MAAELTDELGSDPAADAYVAAYLADGQMGQLVSNHPSRIVRALARALVAATQGAEPVAWEAPEGLGIVRFVSDRRYRLFSPKIRAYYKPYRCSQCNAPPPTAEVNERLHSFLDAAAGDGFVIGGVDAGDLYAEVFPERYAAALQSDQAQAGKGERP